MLSDIDNASLIARRDEKKKRRLKYNQTYYDKHRLRILKQWRDNFVSAKLSKPD